MRLVRILHLSDLHFGPSSRFAKMDPTDIGRLFAKATIDECERNNIDQEIDLVVVSGDIAEAALPSEYDIALRFFEQIAIDLKVDRRRFVFVPGNHDVSWVQCKRAELDLQEQGWESGRLRQLIDARKLLPFESFVKRFQGVGRDELGEPLGFGAYVFEHSDLGISILGLNSCERESHNSEDHIGYLSQGQAQAAMDYWAKKSSLLRIIAVHHNPVPAAPDDVRGWAEFLRSEYNEGKLDDTALARFASDVVGFSGREQLEAISDDCSVQLILHGHHHVTSRQPIPWKRGRKGSTHVLSAGSWGLDATKLPEEQPNALQLIQLDTSKEELRAWSLVYEPRARSKGAVALGSFVIDHTEPEGFYQDLTLADNAKEEALSSSTTDRAASSSERMPPVRRKLPDERMSLTHRYSVSDHEGIITVGLYSDGQPGELFLRMHKEGSTISGLTDAFSRVVTVALQYGVPLEALVDELSHTRFEPSGFTKNPEIPFAKSIIDYVFRWMASQYLDREQKMAAGVILRDQ